MVLFSACAQTPPENNTSDLFPISIQPVRTPPRRPYNYRVEAATQTVGFSLMINGVELLTADGGSSFVSQVEINDWMVSGINNLALTVIWPYGVQFASGISFASVKLFSNNTLVKELKWPASGIPDISSSYPHTYIETFRPSNDFPRVYLERAERVISSTGILPRDDQAEITAIAEQLRRAFSEKDIESIGELLIVKYADLANARFTTLDAVKAEENAKYRELMGRVGYSVYKYGRFIFS
ncbi:MAG: hypothetical protein LBH07_02030 [Treponema sp.]|jgi:hypothetical protein|nr:hypothetical protein [Treponema sp.]